MLTRDSALQERLARHLTGCCFGGRLEAYAQCPSTMEAAHELARQGIGEGALVFAARQEQGRGRLGRKWESPEGGAYFSVILRPVRPLAEIPQLALVAGLAVAETIHEITRHTPTIRWPNDVLIDGKKIAGILVEAKDGAVIVGIGINVSTDPAQLPDVATSLAAAGAEILDPCAVTAAVCRRLDRWYDVWTAKGLAPIREALRPHLTLGGLVRLRTGSQQVEGQFTDLDEQGRLVVRLDSGVLRAFDAGEVTLLR